MRKEEKEEQQPKLCFWCGSEISLFDNLAKKACTQKHYKNWGFSKDFLTDARHETALFGPKKPTPEIPVIIFVVFLSCQQQNTNTC